jgi:predicted DNA-binding transcriptional regulator AlpA
MRWELWDTETIAERTCYSRKYVEEKVVSKPDFPQPIRLGGIGRPRWVASAVMAWFEAQQRAA